VFQEKLKDCKRRVELPISDVKSPEPDHEVYREVEQQVNTDSESENEEEQAESICCKLRDRSLLKKPQKLDDYRYVTTAQAYLTVTNEPECYQEAVNGEDHVHWIKAMNSEMDS